MSQEGGEGGIERHAGADEGVVDVVSRTVMTNGRQELFECCEIAFAQGTRITRELVRRFQALKARWPGKRKIELIIIENVEY